MAWADLEKKRTYQREWTRRSRRDHPLWSERSKFGNRYEDSEARQLARSVSRVVERTHNREKLWRFQMWEIARYPHDLLDFVVNTKELLNPVFVFELNGIRRRENLHSPLPRW